MYLIPIPKEELIKLNEFKMGLLDADLNTFQLDLKTLTTETNKFIKDLKRSRRADAAIRRGLERQADPNHR